MRWLAGWHVGQLVMAWIAAVFLMALLHLGSAFASGSAGVIDYRRERTAQDSVARLPAHSRIIADSLNALQRAGASDTEIELCLQRAGLVDTSFVRPTPSDLIRATLFRLAVVVMLLLAAALPVVMFAATWTWFGGRRRLSTT